VVVLTYNIIVKKIKIKKTDTSIKLRTYYYNIVTETHVHFRRNNIETVITLYRHDTVVETARSHETRNMLPSGRHRTA